MDKYVLLLLLISCVVIASAHPKLSKQYRTDYVYNHKTDAFYKLHTETRQAWQAVKVCEVEGCKLLKPTTQEDKAQILEMLGRFPNLGGYVWISHDDTYGAFQEYDLTKPISRPSDWRATSCYALDVWMSTAKTRCARSLPFICKVEASAAPYDERCGTYGNDYHYIPSVGSCYKIPRIAYTWYMAYSECRAEGGHLLVLNSDAERLAVKDITSREPAVLGSQNNEYLHAGYRSKRVGMFTRHYKTIFDETAAEAGFSEWDQTKHVFDFMSEECGSVFVIDSLQADIKCTVYSGFICEKEIPANK